MNDAGDLQDDDMICEPVKEVEIQRRDQGYTASPTLPQAVLEMLEIVVPKANRQSDGAKGTGKKGKGKKGKKGKGKKGYQEQAVEEEKIESVIVREMLKLRARDPAFYHQGMAYLAFSCYASAAALDQRNRDFFGQPFHVQVQQLRERLDSCREALASHGYNLRGGFLVQNVPKSYTQALGEPYVGPEAGPNANNEEDED